MSQVNHIFATQSSTVWIQLKAAMKPKFKMWKKGSVSDLLEDIYM